MYFLFNVTTACPLDWFCQLLICKVTEYNDKLIEIIRLRGLKFSCSSLTLHHATHGQTTKLYPGIHETLAEREFPSYPSIIPIPSIQAKLSVTDNQLITHCTNMVTPLPSAPTDCSPPKKANKKTPQLNLLFAPDVICTSLCTLCVMWVVFGQVFYPLCSVAINENVKRKCLRDFLDWKTKYTQYTAKHSST